MHAHTHCSDGPLTHAVRREQLLIGKRLYHKKRAGKNFIVVCRWALDIYHTVRLTVRGLKKPEWETRLWYGMMMNRWHTGLNFFLVKQIIWS